MSQSSVQQNAQSPSAHPPQSMRVVMAGVLGTALEYYDFTLFVFLAPIIGSLFFPSDDPKTSLLASLATFALGYVMRPLGSIFFGTIGDRYGRKRALSLSIVLMAFPTFAIGLLPDYSQIGILAPIFLVICRMGQGFCAGGEFNGAGIFTVENVKPTRAGFAGSLISAASPLGSVMGSTVAMLLVLENMPSWSWRVAFILGGVLALAGYFIRTRLWEDFTPGKQEIQKLPLKAVLKTHPMAVICTIGIAIFSVIMVQVPMSYPHLFLSSMKGWTLSEGLSIVSIGRLWYIFCLPMVGLVTDRLGGKRVLLFATIVIFTLIWPIFWLLCNAETYWGVLLADFAMVTVASLFHAPMNIYMAQLFPRTTRYSGVAFGYTVGMAAMGGSTVIIATKLAQDYTPIAPAYFVMLAAIIGFVAVYYSRPKYNLA